MMKASLIYHGKSKAFLPITMKTIFQPVEQQSKNIYLNKLLKGNDRK